MSLILRQTFPLGRFHATRWNQNPFEDPYGEWPPSQWRLLRVLVARWFQYSRETGDEDTTARDALFRKLAGRVPSFCLPEFTWRGQALRQYHPTGLEEQYKYKTDKRTKKKVLDYSFKQIGRTLVEDHYRALPDSEPVYWIFDMADSILDAAELTLLRQLTQRTLYFGRAESHCRLQVVRTLPERCSINCTLTATGAEGSVPVLVVDPNVPLDLEVVLAITDDRLMAGRSIPPGTKWYYARLPERPRLSRVPTPPRRYPEGLHVIQFAIGGRVFPPLDRWIKIAERFRGGVLKACAQRMLDDPAARHRDLTPEQKASLRLLSGKDERGKPLPGHQHIYFVVCPDTNGDPTRLLCYRASPFEPHEINVLLQASRGQYSWESGNPDWFLRFVPLPFSTTLPRGFDPKPARVWISKTPFVPPGNRHRFRKNGSERKGEMPDQLLRKLLLKQGFPEPERIESLSGGEPVDPRSLAGGSRIREWVGIHVTRRERTRRRRERRRAVLPGFRYRIIFREPVRGPLILGHSCHFGLGFFEVES